MLVKSYGGPTSAASSMLSLSTQYWMEPRDWAARRELSRQHRLRPRLPDRATQAAGASWMWMTASRRRAA